MKDRREYKMSVLGTHHLSGEFKFYLTQEGIVSQLSAPGTPLQNGVS